MIVMAFDEQGQSNKEDKSEFVLEHIIIDAATSISPYSPGTMSMYFLSEQN